MLRRYCTSNDLSPIPTCTSSSSKSRRVEFDQEMGIRLEKESTMTSLTGTWGLLQVSALHYSAEVGSQRVLAQWLQLMHCTNLLLWV